jgi:hypothetical protein
LGLEYFDKPASVLEPKLGVIGIHQSIKEIIEDFCADIVVAVEFI